MGLFSFFKKKNEKTAAVQTPEVVPSPVVPTEPVRNGNVIALPAIVDKSNVDLLKRRYIAFDIETTGLSHYAHRIIELGAVLFVDGSPTKRFSTLVNPGMSIPASATAVNGITNDMVASAPTESDAISALVEFLGDAMQGKTVMCAHNASFDFKFLRDALCRLGYDARLQYLDTLKLSRQHVRGLENYKQGTLERYFGLTNDNAHRAVSDAENCGYILYRVLEQAVFVADPILDDDLSDLDDEDFRKAYSYWSRGETARIDGDIEKALQLFNQAREIGYKCPAIYESYAKAYRKLKDYESEISILDEAIQCVGPYKIGLFEERKKKAAELLLAQRERENAIQQKALEKALAKAKKAEEKQRQKEIEAAKPKQPLGRAVIQCSDDGTVIREFESVALAAKEAGVSAKCIRDAANGRQKHAAGFCWKYADQDIAEIEISDCH